MQVGANPELKRYLRDKGVEVVELPFLSPQGATEYLTMRGCLQLFWECGGILAAPAVQHNCIHKVRAHVLVYGCGCVCVRDVKKSTPARTPFRPSCVQKTREGWTNESKVSSHT